MEISFSSNQSSRHLYYEHAEMMIDRLQVLQSSMSDLPNQLSNETLVKTLEETIEDLQWLILV